MRSLGIFVVSHFLFELNFYTHGKTVGHLERSIEIVLLFQHKVKMMRHVRNCSHRGGEDIVGAAGEEEGLAYFRVAVLRPG